MGEKNKRFLKSKKNPNYSNKNKKVFCNNSTFPMTSLDGET